LSARPFLLAFDVSTPVGSVALAKGGEVLARGFLLRARDHAARLLPEIAEILGQAGVRPSELGGIVVGRGPGSFTGIRIAAATARGLAATLGVPLWPRSSLAAAAVSDGVALPEGVAGPAPDIAPEAAAPGPRGPCYVLFDARGDRVYGACYVWARDGLEVIVRPHASTVGEVLSERLPTGIAFAGSGALRHAGRISESGHRVLPPPTGIPTAEGLLRLHSLWSQDEPEPRGSRWEPDYLRGSWARPPAAAPPGPH
jgi:tRNA threonylcarbamoyladenosine biosynthesis protein TsaB